MKNKIINKLKKYILSIEAKFVKKNTSDERKKFLDEGRIPWDNGYISYKHEMISKSICDEGFINGLKSKSIPSNFGLRLDERIIEYSWIFSKLPKGNLKLLDAGSTFNFDFIANHDRIVEKELTIFTYAPEGSAFADNGVSYVYGDLRDIPFKDNLYNFIVSQSTIEHIDMDNSIYGYDIDHHEDVKEKSYEYLLAVNEMVRVLKNKGTLLITVPFGKFENHGFFQQFDNEMLSKMTNIFEGKGTYNLEFFKYEIDGWKFSNQDELVNVVSYNPHTGKGKKDDNAAHCRSVVCVKFDKF